MSPRSPPAPRIAVQEYVIVTVVDFAFQPAGTMIPAGATITWTNTGTAPHTVTADDGSFDSGVLVSGARLSRTFTAPGAVSYRCLLHPMMTGTVIVSGMERTDLSGDETSAARRRFFDSWKSGSRRRTGRLGYSHRRPWFNRPRRRLFG